MLTESVARRKSTCTSQIIRKFANQFSGLREVERLLTQRIRTKRGRWVGDLSTSAVLSMTADMLWTAVLLAAPLIGATTLAALLVSVFQAVTQIQERSLTFVAKLIVAVVVLLTLGGWMLSTLSQFATRLISNIPGYF